MHKAKAHPTPKRPNSVVIDVFLIKKSFDASSAVLSARARNRGFLVGGGVTRSAQLPAKPRKLL